jgi:hypothetical protein
VEQSEWVKKSSRSVEVTVETDEFALYQLEKRKQKGNHNAGITK